MTSGCFDAKEAFVHGSNVRGFLLNNSSCGDGSWLPGGVTLNIQRAVFLTLPSCSAFFHKALTVPIVRLARLFAW